MEKFESTVIANSYIQLFEREINAV